MKEIGRTPEEYYSRRGWEKLLKWFAIWLTCCIILIIISVKCEKAEVGGEGCCWQCAISTTWEYPESSPYEVTVIMRYEFCDCSEDYISRWEQSNSYKDTTQHIVQLARCKR